MNHTANQHLVEAVQAGDGAAVAQALTDGADPNAEVGRFRGSVLVEAARSGRLEIVVLLVDAGASAIVIAARRGDHAAVDVLLQADADVESGDQHGRTALMHAAERNERQVIAALLLAGAATDTISSDGMTALQLARGWQRQNVQFMLGERHAGLDDVPITRTVVRLRHRSRVGRPLPSEDPAAGSWSTASPAAPAPRAASSIAPAHPGWPGTPPGFRPRPTRPNPPQPLTPVRRPARSSSMSQYAVAGIPGCRPATSTNMVVVPCKT
ncbi:ankyrin repeat domain-containing protein [Micromonospora sp. NPDC002717]|uniref:ankyrin repeat domain-containing protein n=1 Tax=Micromonospora sp. NPDC002717 TaxID=3154424 RepID=UPI003325D58D